MKISIIGLGKLGFPMAKFLRNFDFDIICYDISKSLTNKLIENQSDYLKSELDIKKYNKKIKVCRSINECLLNTNITFITVPTPSTSNGKFDNKFILDVLGYISAFIKKKSSNRPHIININSTVSPGSFQNEFIPYMEKKGLINNVDFTFLYNPYFVALGSVFKNLENPDFILAGYSSDYSIITLKKIYRKIYSKNVNIKPMTLEEAEFVKLLVNCYITSKISFTNFVKAITDKSDLASPEIILDAIGSDKRIGKSYFKVGGPFSGPCFPRDNFALLNFCKSKKINYLIPQTTEKINSITYLDLFNILKLLKKKNIKKIGFLGSSYKPNTTDLTDSIALKLMNKAKKIGLEVFYYDYYVNINSKKFKKCKNINSLMVQSEVLFISYIDEKNYYINFSTAKNLIIWDIYSFIKTDKIKKFSNIFQLKKILTN